MPEIFYYLIAVICVAAIGVVLYRFFVVKAKSDPFMAITPYLAQFSQYRFVIRFSEPSVTVLS